MNVVGQNSVTSRLLEDAVSGSKGSQLKGLRDGLGSPSEGRTGDKSFSDYLGEMVGEVNQLQVSADTLSSSVATGASGSLHEAMIANTQAELAFHFMVQVRNRVLEAYQEVMRMQV